VVAFIGSLIVTLAMTAAIVVYAKRRPVGTPTSWGEAMGAAVYIFFLMVFAYGIVPDRWLTVADSELGWRPDKFFVGWGGIFGKTTGLHLPLTITYQAIRDFIVIGIYGAFLAGHVMLWSIWQHRGQKVSTEVETTTYGRPLVKTR